MFTGDGEFVSEEDDIEVEPVVPATAPVVAAVAASKPTVDLTAATDYGFFSAEQIATPSDVSEVSYYCKRGNVQL